MTSSIDITDPKLAKAFAHPLRIQILELLEGRVASPREISDELGVALSNTSYHVRQLAVAGLVEMVDRRTRRGAVEHFYTTRFRPRVADMGWAPLSGGARPALITGRLQEAMAHMAMAAEQGGFDRDDIHYSRTTANLDEEGWKAVAGELRGLLKRIDQIVEGATARVQDDPDPVESTIVLIQYANPAASSDDSQWPPLDEVDERLAALHPGAPVAEPRELMSSIDITDPRLAKAFAHPLRVQILELLEGRVASPREMSNELGSKLSNTSYHVRRLATAGLVELVDRRTRGGAVEHYYTTKSRPRITDTGWARLPDIAKRALITGVLQKAMTHMAVAAEQGGFDRDDIHYSRTTAELDEGAWRDVARALRDLLKRIDQIAEDAAARVEGDPGRPTVEATIVLVQYANPAASSEDPRQGPPLDEVDSRLPALREDPEA
jgi:DNA-binding transcriptional ArsR family regulator